MADNKMELVSNNLSGEISALKAQVTALTKDNPDVDFADLTQALAAMDMKHRDLVTAAHTANATKPGSNSEMGPAVHATDKPPVIPFSTPENTPRITPQNVSLPEHTDDPSPYPFPATDGALDKAPSQGVPGGQVGG